MGRWAKAARSATETSETATGDRPSQELHTRRLAFAELRERPEEGTERVDLVLALERVELGDRQAQLTAGRHPAAGKRRDGGNRVGAGSGPGGLDGPLDQAGTRPGTQSAMVSPPSVAVNSKPRWGWPPRSRRQAGRSRATRFVHMVVAPWGSTSGGVRTTTSPGAFGHAPGLGPACHAEPDEGGEGGPGDGRSERDGQVGVLDAGLTER